MIIHKDSEYRNRYHRSAKEFYDWSGRMVMSLNADQNWRREAYHLALKRQKEIPPDTFIENAYNELRNWLVSAECAERRKPVWEIVNEFNEYHDNHDDYDEDRKK